jgi:hypothetical protein
VPQGYSFMNSSNPERISRNPCKQKGLWVQVQHNCLCT